MLGIIVKAIYFLLDDHVFPGLEPLKGTLLKRT